LGRERDRASSFSVNLTIEAMQLLSEFDLFADHYQFFVYDSESEMCPESFYEEPDDQRSDFGCYDWGFITNGTTINFGTFAHLNSHWIQCYLADQQPDFEQAERVIALPLQVDSGKIAISDLISEAPYTEITVMPGLHAVYCLAFNLEIDQDEEAVGNKFEDPTGLSESERRARFEAEYYQIVFVPGAPSEVGVVKGFLRMGDVGRDKALRSQSLSL
jgi:hypothetical protein